MSHIEVTHDWDDENYVASLTTAFEEYRIACYGNITLSQIQEREVRQAFWSGIHWLNTRDSYDPAELEKALRQVLNQPGKAAGDE